MAQLTINQCQVCSKVLAPGVTVCPKCHTEHSIKPTVVNPLRFSAAESAEYKSQFEEQVRNSPQDSNMIFAMGLTYLGLKNYELSDEHFRNAVALTPSNPDVYYYTALSLFHHRSVSNLDKMEMERIEQWLDTAVQMQPKRKYLILQMILRQGMSNKGLNTDTDKLSPAELMQKARSTAQEEDELYEIEQHVLITDEQTRTLLDALTSANKADDKESALFDTMDEYFDFCDHPRPDDNTFKAENIKKLTDENVRRNFFNAIHQPGHPVRQDCESYFRPLFKSALRGVVAVLALFVVSIINAGFLRWVKFFGYKEESAKERIADVREREKNYKILFVDYADEAGKRHFVKSPLSDEQIAAFPVNAEYNAIKHGWKGYAGLILVCSPLLIWLLMTVVRFASCAKDHRDVRRRYSSDMKKYNAACEAYRERPTIEEYKLFCALFAGPNSSSVINTGDFVKEALRQAYISEMDVKNGNGKIFFSCYLLDIDGDDNVCKDPVITLRSMVVRICIAMRDSIVILHGTWDTINNYMPSFDQERLLYSQVASFRNASSYNKLEIVSHSNSVLATVIYGFGEYPSLFRYQGLNPSDTMTYSTTRTSDFNEFYNSLITMHNAYNKKS